MTNFDINNAYLGTDQVSKIYLGQDLIYPTTVDYSAQYLTIEALETGTLNARKAITYSINDGTWASSTGETALSLNAGDKVRFKGDSNTDTVELFSGNTLSSNVYGNIMSLKYGDNFSGQTTSFSSSEMFRSYTGLVDASNLILPATTLVYNCYARMFQNCTNLTGVPELPATTLASYCYYLMFAECTSLVDALELPATTMVERCYNGMFENCTSLTTAPDLPATVLAEYCYLYMFQYCSSLNYIKCLATDISATDCTYKWADGVASAGTFVKNSAMSSWTTGINGIPSGWTVVDA